MTPLDLVKCRRQVDAKMYKSNFEAWGKIGRAEGLRGIFTGWSPTLFGYSVGLFDLVWCSGVLILCRLKVPSSMEGMNSLKSFIRISQVKILPVVTRPLFILPPAPLPSLSPTLRCARLKR